MRGMWCSKEAAVLGRKLDLRWMIGLPLVAVVAVAVLLFARQGTGEAPTHEQAVAMPAYTSQTLGAREYRADPAPTLEQSLRAADLLVKAGEMAPPVPTLMESLQAADLLVKAGKLARAPAVADGVAAGR